MWVLGISLYLRRVGRCKARSTGENMNITAHPVRLYVYIITMATCFKEHCEKSS